MLLCVQTGKTVSDDNRLKIETDELYLKSADEMNQGFDYCPGAVERTLEIADRCNVDIEFGKYHFPNFTPPKEISLDDYLDELAHQGLERTSRRHNRSRSSERVMWSGSNTNWA